MSGCPYSLLTWMTKLVWNKPLDWRLFTSSDTLLDFFTHELTWMWFSHGWPHGQNEIDSTHYQLPHFLVSFIPLLIFFFFLIYIHGNFSFIDELSMRRLKVSWDQTFWVMHLCQSTLEKCRSAFQECRMALLGVESAFEFWYTLDSFFEVF